MNDRFEPDDAARGVRQDHWDEVCARGDEQVSWFQADPAMSLELIETLLGDPSPRDRAVIDVGGGTSRLASRLIAGGFTDVTVLDVSAAALEVARRRPGGDQITWIHADLLTWRPIRRYGIWHDRAVFHFLTDPADRAAYLAALGDAIEPGGGVVLGTFAPEGPAHCSGLPVARYTVSDLDRELTAAFGDELTVTGHRGEHHHTPAGAVQPFTWITARLG